ncbi:uncharacterized protein N7484_002115 [Penicillium longicatenatum]|uniref:uncharacterized protein n=1 Tax=Penicillium longicatenatum TaxID=1561947 RepID=UPI0025480663|nr:uncharacterized protein N7484_002115 [Penicillium longicatenatum]KAJ5658466.1 hypothetical protein N7484_002115 [Penicillium longicatenatum]
MSAPQTPGEAILIPKTFHSQQSLNEVVERYKNLRLHGLQVDPKSFSSTYEVESQFSPATWRSRLQNPAGQTFVSVANSDTNNDTQIDTVVSIEPKDPDTSLQRLLRKDWIGIVTLLGPVLFKSDADKGTPTKPWNVFIEDRNYVIPQSDLNRDAKNEYIVYLVVAMFVLPDARRKGHASRLLETLVQTVRKDANAREASKASITIQVEPENGAAQRLYEKLGFEVWDKALPLDNKRGETNYVVALVKEIDLA